jgi:hypothetical protein
VESGRGGESPYRRGARTHACFVGAYDVGSGAGGTHGMFVAACGVPGRVQVPW